jgi:hypothetical protein
MAENFPADTLRSRMLGGSWNYETAGAACVRRAQRRREKQGWLNVDALIQDAPDDEVQSILERGSSAGIGG